MPEPDVSIVIPTLDGADTLPGVLDAIERQDTTLRIEVVAIDSGSTDGTAELLERRADRLVRIARETFDHGLARNLGIECARGELLVLLVQDAEPASPLWLEALTKPLREDEEVAGAFARQIPRADASRIARRALRRFVAGQDAPRRVQPGHGLDGLDPMQRLDACTFDNVCSCIRRAAWKDAPFPATDFAEDIAWAQAVLRAGWAVVYAPAAAVFHSHDRSVLYEYRRTVASHRRLRALFGVRTIPSRRHLGRAWAVTLADHMDCLLRESGPRPDAAEVARAMALAVAWPLGQYVGGRPPCA